MSKGFNWCMEFAQKSILLSSSPDANVQLSIRIASLSVGMFCGQASGFYFVIFDKKLHIYLLV